MNKKDSFIIPSRYVIIHTMIFNLKYQKIKCATRRISVSSIYPLQCTIRPGQGSSRQDRREGSSREPGLEGSDTMRSQPCQRRTPHTPPVS